MPDFDSGHIFLTTMAPIKPGAPDDDPQTSYEQRVRIALAQLPTANQSPATIKGRFNSPFARNTRTHLARIFVLDNVIYNGRIPQNPIVGTVQGKNPITPQHVDRLRCPYLVFCADVDAVVEDGEQLPAKLSAGQQRKVRASYARKLWQTMEEELRDLYGNCYGFDGVETADQFADYLDDCHVETTMPFHDYYLKLPKFNVLPLTAMIVAVLAPLALGLLGLVLWLFGMTHVPWLGWPLLPAWFLALGLAVALTLLFIFYALWNGRKPLAPAEYDDLPSVLKAIYMQQRFADFFVETQGASNAELHAAYGDFLAATRPADLARPTQKPGVISADDPANVIS